MNNGRTNENEVQVRLLFNPTAMMAQSMLTAIKLGMVTTCKHRKTYSSPLDRKPLRKFMARIVTEVIGTGEVSDVDAIEVLTPRTVHVDSIEVDVAKQEVQDHG